MVPPFSKILPPAMESTERSKPVLKIGSEDYTAAELWQQLQDHQLLPQLCRAVFLDQMTSGLTLTAADIELGRQAVYQKYQFDTERDRQAWQQRQGMDAPQFERWLQRQIQLEVFKRQQWGAEISSHFLKRKESLDRAIYSRISHECRGIGVKNQRECNNQKTFSGL